MKRLQLEVTEPTLRRIDGLTEATGCATRSELIRRAIDTYACLLEARERGGHVVLEMPAGTRDIEIPVPRPLTKIPEAP